LYIFLYIFYIIIIAFFRIIRKEMAERSQASELSTSKKQVRLQFLDAETNKVLDCYLSPEDAQRVSVGNV